MEDTNGYRRVVRALRLASEGEEPIDELLRRQKAELVSRIREIANRWRRTYHDHPSSPSDMLAWADGADLIADEL
jgi:hypothetical protein